MDTDSDLDETESTLKALEGVAMQHLVEILGNARYLTRFQLNGAEDFFSFEPRLVSNIQSMELLKVLVLKRISDRGAAVMRNLSAPLTALGLWGRSSYPFDDELLANFAGSFVHLVLPSIEPPTELSRIQCPRVECLAICQTPPLRSISTLIHLFPNVTSLSIQEDDTDIPMSERVEFRRRNQLVQETERWSALDYLGGYVTTLWTLAIQCPVRHLVLVARSD
ncbi:hypothetical protein CERSUDRAFT_125310, partial [Gelatoporia subvermispora B]